ncbi:O-acetyl-ADP-ribose deacetylase [bacterium]|uniref:Appr-1-p processing domain protein n=1 Tax=Rubinisphaera brasiliensis (strain ATCC 49424 / DSM 5305 / JCM 21570 / IAM 15109 / NBRC 103401 / IFAM 1448) TaxID=756272 RepID=F0SFI4_RUBBR|nr:O-acetyl-ADP-ribose deacetylase [Rubinisphaera brasiliensis]ADY59391.1 Appr-1-p processing domain protein [Rubinisphaera brasiliensis DSM 5305]MBB03234.1 O-acetyl-ADP-ribose deacetylase [Planctomyces sp.]MBR9800207.1 O-acetyl-ADP-ribose deacetylase [bacterium]
MKLRICRTELQLVVGDITVQQVDAVVNAANSRLAGGAGVDGAIHRAAGPTVMQQLRSNYPNGCPVGQAAVTEAGQLPAKYIFHAVGPIWRGGRQQEAEALASAYRVCLELAEELKCSQIAFPAISTGAYGYPLDLATEVALTQIRDYLQQGSNLQEVRCVLFSEGHYGAYGRVLESWENDTPPRSS